jgi:hypothetical protein
LYCRRPELLPPVTLSSPPLPVSVLIRLAARRFREYSLSFSRLVAAAERGCFFVMDTLIGAGGIEMVDTPFGFGVGGAVSSSPSFKRSNDWMKAFERLLQKNN